MKVLLSSSYKFIDKWDGIKRDIEEQGLECITPKDIDIDLYGKYENLTKEEILKAHQRYFEILEESDILYVVNQGNYLGKSMLLEIGLASGLGKKVVSIEPIDESPFHLFVNGSIENNRLLDLITDIKV